MSGPVYQHRRPLVSVSYRMSRLANLLHLGAVPLWDGDWSPSRGRLDPILQGMAIVRPGSFDLSPAAQELFASRPRLRTVLMVTDRAQVIAFAETHMRGGKPALAEALVLRRAAEVKA